MKVFFLIQRFEKPSSRYRVLQYLPTLREMGIEPEVAAVSDGVWSRISTLKKAQAAPIVFIQKKLFHNWELRLLRARGARLIYDFDDAIMLRHKPNPGEESATRRRQFEAIARASERVLAGNRFLEQKARELHANAVWLPTTVDTEKIRIKPQKNENGGLTLGWLGSAGTLVYLESILPVLEEMARRHPKLRLKVVSSVFPKGNRLPIECKNWNLEEEVIDLHSFDIGLAPLARDPWCEGKCGLKLLQYMACGVPSVASPGGAQKEIVADGKNGFLASTPQEWSEKISILIQDIEKRKTLGLAGRQTVEQTYSLKKGAQQLVQVIRGLNN